MQNGFGVLGVTFRALVHRIDDMAIGDDGEAEGVRGRRGQAGQRGTGDRKKIAAGNYLHKLADKNSARSLNLGFNSLNS